MTDDAGALRLAAPEDDWSRADWEKAAAAALRKSRRLTDDDADDAVWSMLARTTYDGITITPLGTPDLLARPGHIGPAHARGRRGTSAP